MLLTPRRDVGLGKTMAYLVCNSHRLSQFLSSFVCLRRRVDVRALYVGTVVRSWCVCGRSTSHCHDTVATFVSGDCLRGEDLFRTGRSFPPRWVSWRAKVVTQGGSAARLCMRPSCRGMAWVVVFLQAVAMKQLWALYVRTVVRTWYVANATTLLPLLPREIFTW